MNKAFQQALNKRGLRAMEPLVLPPAVDIQTRLAILEADLGIAPEKAEGDHAPKV